MQSPRLTEFLLSQVEPTHPLPHLLRLHLPVDVRKDENHPLAQWHHQITPALRQWPTTHIQACLLDVLPYRSAHWLHYKWGFRFTLFSPKFFAFFKLSYSRLSVRGTFSGRKVVLTFLDCIAHLVHECPEINHHGDSWTFLRIWSVEYLLWESST